MLYSSIQQFVKKETELLLAYASGFSPSRMKYIDSSGICEDLKISLGQTKYRNGRFGWHFMVETILKESNFVVLDYKLTDRGEYIIKNLGGV